MRAEFARLISSFPKAPSVSEPITGSPLQTLVTELLPAAIRRALPATGNYLVSGSIGKGVWTHTPWVAGLDPSVTSTVEEDFYVVYLLSRGCERLYLSINQGCTTLRNSNGIPGARLELQRRASLMWSRVKDQAVRLGPIPIDLNVDRTIWRGKLYEQGGVAGVIYDANSLPAEDILVSDLAEALDLYRQIKICGGWDPDDSIVHEAHADGVSYPVLEQAKLYRLHRRIERQASHAKAVKKIQGYRCKGCDYEMYEIYGDVAKEIIEAHHLKPLSELEHGKVTLLDPRKDFVVLCPNCHKIIHQLEKPDDIVGLRKLVAAGILKRNH